MAMNTSLDMPGPQYVTNRPQYVTNRESSKIHSAYLTIGLIFYDLVTHLIAADLKK